ncbi:MAG TPA: hypothetical protein VFG04_20655 [Planctomycetaceae bacterium]|jgi:hypothetical protein|nr:hypothetical protein [Planctomycetaceae bacterium]
MPFDWVAISAVLADSAEGGIWPAAVAVSAIVMGSSFAIVRSIINHRERMAKIGMGIDPDVPSVEWTRR